MNFDEIKKQTQEDLEKLKKDFPFDWLGRSLAYNNYPPRDIMPIFENDEKYKIIPTLAKSSKLDKNYDPLAKAQSYEKQDVSAICVATEPHFFKSDLELLTSVRRYVSTPLLRDDFLFDEYQILQSAVYGADFVLLIARILSKKELKKLIEFAMRLRMEVLVEIRSKEDLTKAVFAGASMLLINHEDIEKESLDLTISQKLITLIPNGKIIFAKGGIKKENIDQLKNIGIDAFIVDEYFIKTKEN